MLIKTLYLGNWLIYAVSIRVSTRWGWPTRKSWEDVALSVNIVRKSISGTGHLAVTVTALSGRIVYYCSALFSTKYKVPIFRMKRSLVFCVCICFFLFGACTQRIACKHCTAAFKASLITRYNRQISITVGRATRLVAGCGIIALAGAVATTGI